MPLQVIMEGVTRRGCTTLSPLSSYFSKEEEGSGCNAATDAAMTPSPNYETDSDGCERRDNELAKEESVAKKKRGSVKRRMVKARLTQRRLQANARERSRMDGLNDALERLRRHMPFHSQTQKLSKIETLRLARNYIEALAVILSTDRRPNQVHFAKKLCQGLSTSAVNLVANYFEVSSRLLHQTSEVSKEEEPFANYRSSCLLSCSVAPPIPLLPLAASISSVSGLESSCYSSDAAASSPGSYWSPDPHAIHGPYDHSTLSPSFSDHLLDPAVYPGYSMPCHPDRLTTPLLADECSFPPYHDATLPRHFPHGV